MFHFIQIIKYIILLLIKRKQTDPRFFPLSLPPIILQKFHFLKTEKTLKQNKQKKRSLQLIVRVC